MDSLSDLELRISAIEQRNRVVGLDKRWETSVVRKVLLMVFTYLAILSYFLAIGLKSPFLNAAVPTIGFLLSTLTLPFFKKIWIKFQSQRQTED